MTTLINKRNKSNEKLPNYSINNKLGFIPQSEQFDGVDSEDRGYVILHYIKELIRRPLHITLQE